MVPIVEVTCSTSWLKLVVRELHDLAKTHLESGESVPKAAQKYILGSELLGHF